MYVDIGQRHLIRKLDWSILIVIQGLTYEEFKPYYENINAGYMVPVNTNSTNSLEWFKHVFYGIGTTIPYFCGVTLDLPEVTFNNIFKEDPVEEEQSGKKDLTLSEIKAKLMYQPPWVVIVHIPKGDLQTTIGHIKDIINNTKDRIFVITGDSGIAPWWVHETEFVDIKKTGIKPVY